MLVPSENRSLTTMATTMVPAEVATLRELCVRLLYKATLGHVGAVPAELLRPVLERFDAQQLAEFEVRCAGREPCRGHSSIRVLRVVPSSSCASLICASRVVPSSSRALSLQALNPELKPSTSELWRPFCRSEPPPRDGPVDWRAAYAVEKGVHRALLKQAASRLTARVEVARCEKASRRIVLLEGDVPGAGRRAGGASAQRRDGACAGPQPGKAPSALQALHRKVFPPKAAHATTHRAARPSSGPVGQRPTASASLRVGPPKPAGLPSPERRSAQPPPAPPAKLSLEASLGARPQLLAGHKRRLPGAPPPPKLPRLGPAGEVILLGCGPTMRSAKLAAPPKPNPQRGGCRQQRPSAASSGGGSASGAAVRGGQRQGSGELQRLREVDITALL